MKKIIKNHTEKKTGRRSGVRKTLLRLMSVGLMANRLYICYNRPVTGFNDAGTGTFNISRFLEGRVL